MIKLNLTAESKPQELILAYLQENASETLAKKINYGTSVNKDGKELINKKTLSGFMTFASGEAKKLAEKGAREACVEDKVVYGWAIHYFEEDSIIGTLYNEDGTEYKAVTKSNSKPTVTSVKVEPQKPKVQQSSLFDMMTGNTAENSGNSSILHTQPQITANTEEKPKIAVTPVIPPIQPQKQPSPLYQLYLNLQARYKDCIVWIRLGDFYEAFENSAVTAAKELDLTLTGRDCGLENRVPMCGVPYHAADAYFEKLISKGYKVAVAEDSKGESVSVLNKNTVTDESGQTVDIETGEIINDEMTEEEMRAFDSYVDEAEELPTVSKITEGIDTDNDGDDFLAQEKEFAKAFDSEVVAILSELFDGEINIA